ncbi:MAG: 5-formyltetrahydrofolate cyclo-ligase [Woeseia sp.]|nr:5-formyltetrahydrofolate cyclo-ligase [Woeseia sp.]
MGDAFLKKIIVVFNLKNDARKKALLARRNMSVKERRIASEKISKKIILSCEFLNAELIACYLPMIDEVDTRLVIEHGWRAKKRIFLPKMHDNRELTFCEIKPDTPLIRKRNIVWEPENENYISPKELQLVITPTVAFDENYNRIGMGKGYYDHCFSFLRENNHEPQPKLIGAAFHCQKVEKISVNSWDIRLFGVFCEK